jgi:hypothetical protein
MPVPALARGAVGPTAAAAAPPAAATAGVDVDAIGCEPGPALAGGLLAGLLQAATSMQAKIMVRAELFMGVSKRTEPK